jgi:NlpC/P60 family protein
MATGGDVVTIASSEIGKPYVWDAADPTVGFDCSGLVLWAYAQLGISLPHKASEQQKLATPVSNPVPGDLVFYGLPATHVGIYAGNGKMISAPHAGAHVHLTDVGTPTGYGRVKGLSTISTVVDSVVGATTSGLSAHAKDLVLEFAFLGLGAGLLGYGLWRSLDPGTRASLRDRVSLKGASS